MLICKLCFKPLKQSNLTSLFAKHTMFCGTCLNSLNPLFKRTKLEGFEVMYIYEYDEVIRSLLYQLKGTDDYELYPLFLSRFAFYLRRLFKDYVLVPAPSSSEDDLRRGFNHVEVIFGVLNLPFIKAVKKTSSIKQTERSKEERKLINDNLQLTNESKQLGGKKILLVDDVLTTGSTLKALANLITPLYPKKIKILVLAKVVKDSSNNPI